ncbi:MAG: C-type lectin-like domain-containing protein [Phycisphaerales bacterium]
MISRLVLWVAAGWVCLSAGRVCAAPIPFGGHYYEFVQVADPYTGNNNAWGTVAAVASAGTFNGWPGHLATVTASAENDFLMGLVAGQFTQFAGAWLGGRDPVGWLAGPETGQAFTYTNWGGLEPNNDGYAYMNIGPLFANIATGRWADDSGVQGVPAISADPVVGYFVEYEVPEPASMSVFVLSGLSLLMRRRVAV